MANFIIDLLEFNKKKVKEFKSIAFKDKLWGSEWAYDNLGIIVALITVLMVLAIATLSLLILPITIVMIIINAVYTIVKRIFKSAFLRVKYIKKSLNEYEGRLNKRSTYYLKQHTAAKSWDCVVLDPSIEEFLIKFFNVYNRSYSTYRSGTDELICRNYRRRSVGDLYLICKNYFPDTNLDEVLISLIKLVKSDKLAVSKCSEIKKYVFVTKDSYTGNYLDKELDFIKGINFEQLIAYYERSRRLS